MPAMGYDRPKTSSGTAGSVSSVVRRRSSLVQVIITLSWIVGITGSFLAVGIIGMFAADLPPIHLQSLADINEIELPLEEGGMPALLSPQEEAEQSADIEPVVPVEIPETIETPPENLDLPEIAEAMTMEDIFAIPTAPKIENALRPVDPVIKSRMPAPARPRAGPVARSSGTRSSATQAGVAGGGGASSGAGQGRRPAPPYPEFARGAGMQGIVRMSISVGPSGAVEGVSVIGTSGFSALDEYAASWVRRNWQWPASSTAHRYSQPLNFRLH
jgi:periplasmic protein TonB